MSINELPARFQILATGTHYYDVDVAAGTLTSCEDVYYGYEEKQMLGYIKSGVWKITKVYEENENLIAKEVSDLL